MTTLTAAQIKMIKEVLESVDAAKTELAEALNAPQPNHADIAIAIVHLVVSAHVVNNFYVDMAAANLNALKGDSNV